MPLHVSQQLTHSEAKGIVTELWAPISPANASGVIDPDAQQNGVRGLASQLSAAMPLLLPAMRHLLKTIATHTKGIDDRGAGQSHPLPSQSLAPATALPVPPSNDPAVADHQQLTGWGLGLHRSMW